MNIKVAAFTASEKSSNICYILAPISNMIVFKEYTFFFSDVSMFITVTCSTYIEACTCLLKPVRINTCLTCPTSHLQRMRSCQLFELRDELKDMEQIVLEIGEALVRISLFN